MNNRTFLAVGGPKNGQYIEDDEDDYVRFNSSIGECYPTIIFERGDKSYHIGARHRLARKVKIQPYIPSCVLVYLPEPDTIILKG